MKFNLLNKIFFYKLYFTRWAKLIYQKANVFFNVIISFAGICTNKFKFGDEKFDSSSRINKVLRQNKSG